MERESFADTAVARVMNEHFVCVMVDREERPDVDQRYAAAAEVITGNAGWPLNCLALPDGRPFFAGTYYPRAEWSRLLQEYASLYGRQPEALQAHAEKVARGLRAGSLPPGTHAEKPSREALTTAFANWTRTFDTREGGYGRAPKFPLPASLQALLGYYHFTRDSTALKQALLTLDKLASGGIYDHLGGGFARYAVDRSWRVPHFEKMLYDNAQLASVYARAYQLTGNERYKTVVAETLDFVAREMTHPEGGCYGSLDADSEGEEGRFYAWTAAEIGRHLGPEAAPFNEAYHVTETGNWEAGRNVLYLTARTAGGTAALAESRRKLLAARGARPRPLVDRKVIAGWNALMVRGYAMRTGRLARKSGCGPPCGGVSSCSGACAPATGACTASLRGASRPAPLSWRITLSPSTPSWGCTGLPSTKAGCTRPTPCSASPRPASGTTAPAIFTIPPTRLPPPWAATRP
jgi:uncharacterized protein YyaL (SSP411 family)